MKYFVIVLLAFLGCLFYLNYQEKEKFPLMRYDGVWLTEKPTGKRQLFGQSGGFFYIAKNKIAMFNAVGMTREGIISNAVEVDRLKIKLVGNSPVEIIEKYPNALKIKLNNKIQVIEKISDGIIQWRQNDDIQGVILYRSSELSDARNLEEEIISKLN